MSLSCGLPVTMNLEAYVEFQGANLVDFVTDECGDSPEIDATLQSLAKLSFPFPKKIRSSPEPFLG